MKKFTEAEFEFINVSATDDILTDSPDKENTSSEPIWLGPF